MRDDAVRLVDVEGAEVGQGAREGRELLLLGRDARVVRGEAGAIAPHELDHHVAARVVDQLAQGVFAERVSDDAPIGRAVLASDEGPGAVEARADVRLHRCAVTHAIPPSPQTRFLPIACCRFVATRPRDRAPGEPRSAEARSGTLSWGA